MSAVRLVLIRAVMKSGDVDPSREMSELLGGFTPDEVMTLKLIVMQGLDDLIFSDGRSLNMAPDEAQESRVLVHRLLDMLDRVTNPGGLDRPPPPKGDLS